MTQPRAQLPISICCQFPLTQFNSFNGLFYFLECCIGKATRLALRYHLLFHQKPLWQGFNHLRLVAYSLVDILYSVIQVAARLLWLPRESLFDDFAKRSLYGHSKWLHKSLDTSCRATTRQLSSIHCCFFVKESACKAIFFGI